MGPNRNKAFMWKLCHGKLMTNVERKSRGMTADELCPRCHRCLETIMHMIRDCDDVKEFWSKLIDPDSWSSFFSLGLHSWLNWNLSSKAINPHNINWPMTFGIAVKDIWKDRNSLVFSQVSIMGSNL